MQGTELWGSQARRTVPVFDEPELAVKRGKDFADRMRLRAVAAGALREPPEFTSTDSPALNAHRFSTSQLSSPLSLAPFVLAAAELPLSNFTTAPVELTVICPVSPSIVHTFHRGPATCSGHVKTQLIPPI